MKKAKVTSGLFFRIKSYGEYDNGDIVELGSPCIDGCEDNEQGNCIGVLGCYCALDLLKDGIIELCETK